jgi:hypothetical protein
MRELQTCSRRLVLRARQSVRQVLDIQRRFFRQIFQIERRFFRQIFEVARRLFGQIFRVGRERVCARRRFFQRRRGYFRGGRVRGSLGG